MNTIYKITNLVNGKVYVGQTWQTLQARFTQHISQKACVKLGRAIDKYGRENFTIEKLADAFTQLEADVLEIHFIAKLDAITSGYNLKGGGSRGRHDVEARQKISNYMKGKQHAKGNTNRRGVVLPTEQRARISVALKGNTNGSGKRSDEFKRQMSLVQRAKRWVIERVKAA